MLRLPERLPAVTHPFVSSIYLKTEYGNHELPEDVLVIETTTDDEDHLLDLLDHLDDLRLQAEQTIGHFQRIDIRTH